MGKYFGTDGIRGKFGEKLTIDLAFTIGKAAGTCFGQGARVCIGQDPRRSSSSIELALASGLVAVGVNVDSLGITSTPSISYSIINSNYDAGIMISASHNPYYDNGIKFFGSNGNKLSDQLESTIEQLIDSQNYNLQASDKLGEYSQNLLLVTDYIDFLIANGKDLTGLKICLDCANGSSYKIAPNVFEKLGAEVEVIGNYPDGLNINEQVGSTHPETISNYMQGKDFDFGFAYDGDADRIILLAGDGTVLDGDYILYLLAKHFKNNDLLTNNVLISTVMANLGLIEALASDGIEVIKTSVGDRFVMQAINEHDAAVGGEQSGHIILPHLLPTGDGILVSVFLANLIAESNQNIAALTAKMEKFPQVLINKKVVDKVKAMEDPKLLAQIEKYEQQLGTEGRILVRFSGTEELVRVMVEAKDIETCQSICEHLMEYVN